LSYRKVDTQMALTHFDNQAAKPRCGAWNLVAMK